MHATKTVGLKMDQRPRAITCLSPSSDGDAGQPGVERDEPAPPPAKRRRVGNGAAGSSGAQDLNLLWNQTCDCFRQRKKASETCFSKVRCHKDALHDLRERFHSMHKVDQDQFVPCL